MDTMRFINRKVSFKTHVLAPSQISHILLIHKMERHLAICRQDRDDVRRCMTSSEAWTNPQTSTPEGL